MRSKAFKGYEYNQGYTGYLISEEEKRLINQISSLVRRIEFLEREAGVTPPDEDQKPLPPVPPTEDDDTEDTLPPDNDNDGDNGDGDDEEDTSPIEPPTDNKPLPPEEDEEEDEVPVPPVVKEAPTFFGLISPYKPISDITYEDLNVETVKQGVVVKPQSVYQHTEGVQLNRSCIIAFPKTFGSITGVVDASNNPIDAAYEWQDTTLNIPGIGDVTYVIGGNKVAQMYNNSSCVKWNIQ